MQTLLIFRPADRNPRPQMKSALEIPRTFFVSLKKRVYSIFGRFFISLNKIAIDVNRLTTRGNPFSWVISLAILRLRRIRGATGSCRGTRCFFFRFETPKRRLRARIHAVRYFLSRRVG